MRQHGLRQMVLVAAVLLLTGFAAVPARAEITAIAPHTAYEHDPRLNARAMEDIVADPTAVYGFAPDPESARLGVYADQDWSDEASVAEWQKVRIEYHEGNEELYTLWEKLRQEGADTETIARAVSARRNELRLESYQGDAEGLAKVKASNLQKYGDENGPTAESLYEKYNHSWETVLLKAFSSNAGMDACLGLYDAQYEQNLLTGEIEESDVPVYVVQKGDYLVKIAQHYFGDGSRWRRIYEANRDSIRSAELIYEGQQLRIPLD